MKKYIYALILVVGFFRANTQGNNPEARQRMKEKLEAQRVAFITNRLDLTADESSRFWPIYNEFAKKRMEIKKDNKSDLENNPDENIEDQLEKEEKILDLKKIYYEKLKAVIPPSKIAQLEEAERQFKVEIIRALKQRKGR